MATEFPVGANTKPAVNNIDAMINALRKAGKEAGLTEKEIKDMEVQFKKTANAGTKGMNDINKSMNNMNGIVKELGNKLVAFFAVEKLLGFAKQVFAVTAEFQKMKAVLATTLGSQSEAEKAFARIQSFAAKTPFQVKEVTEAFIKLANRGFVPTNTELRKLGDLAASQGKDLNMLVEAMLDAQTFEFERLKEFGIKTKQTANSIIFNFKGVKTEVAKNEEAVRKYILSLGDLEGVAGGMAAVSETLAGKFSNVEDSVDRFFNAFGSENTGPVMSILNFISRSLDYISERLEGKGAAHMREVAEGFDKIVESLKSLNDEMSITAKIDELTKANEDLSKQMSDVSIELAQNSNAAGEWSNKVKSAIGTGTDYQATADALSKKLDELGVQWDINAQGIKQLQDQLKKLNAVTETKTLGLIEELELKLKHLKEGKEKAFDTGMIHLFNNEIRRTQQELDKLNKIGSEDFGPIKVIDLARRITEGYGDTIEVIFKRAMKAAGEVKDKIDKDEQDRLSKEKKRLEELKEAKQYEKQTAIAAINEIVDARQAAYERDIDLLEHQKDRELELAGDNKDAQRAINEKFDKEQLKLKQKQANIELAQSVFNLAISQGPAIAKTAATLGYPLAIPFVLAVGALFAGLIAKQRALTPRFAADGDYDIQGPGTETSDSIPYYLSVHETVAPARVTKKFGWLLKPMIDNENLSVLDIKRLIDAHVPTELRGDLFRPASSGGDSSRLERKLDEVKGAIENKSEMHLSIDEDGFHKWVRRGDNWTEYVNKRYRR